MKKIISVILFSNLLMFVNAANIISESPKLPAYKNSKLSVEKRINDLLSRMTLEEKIAQMSAIRLGEGDEVFKTSGKYSIDNIRAKMGTRGIGHFSCPTTDMSAAMSVKAANEIQKVAIEETRLGIPTIIDEEALHGCNGRGSTSYPQSIALSCTWDLTLMGQIGDAIGKETLSRGVRQVLSPVLDLARDSRHGRVEETYGEDPFLAAKFGVEYIKGVQKNGLICTPKHFVANFVGEGGREAGNIAITEREMREIHMVPYKAAVLEGGTKSMMVAYNAYDGTPCTSNHWLLTDVLRNEWDFKGFTVSDWSGINHMMDTQKTAQSLGEAAMLASKAGLDVDLPRSRAFSNLSKMVKDGKMDESSIDINVKRVLRVKFELGLFENPYIDENLTTQLNGSDEFKQLARNAARESIVLLKNKNNILPLKFKNIAVIGPNADKLQLGGFSARNVKGVTPIEGIRSIFGNNAHISYSKGCELTGADKTGFEQAIKTAQQADVTVLVMGGQNGTKGVSKGQTGGEMRDRVDLKLFGVQEDLIQEISALGKPVVIVLIDGRPSTMLNWIDKVDGVIMMFYGGQEGGNALAEILKGTVNPSGKLSMTFPRHTGQLPMPLLHRPYGREGGINEYPEMPDNNLDPTLDNRYYPLFPFGYGLSYTSYKYGKIKLSKKEVGKDENIHFTVDVSNTGNIDGAEIVQVYLTDLYCRISQSKRILKTFQRINIAAGETKTVEFTLPNSNFSFLNEKLKPEVEAGEFDLFVGTNCMEGVSERFNVK